MPLLVVMLMLVLGGGGGFYGRNHWGYRGGVEVGGGTVLVIFLIAHFMGAFQ